MKFSKPLLITKLKATAVHLSMSIVVFVYLAYQIYYNWYPEPYFSIDGGWAAIRLVGAVDLVLGPLITFLIFDLSKSRRAILFDLLIILVIQLGALAYGVYTTYTQRPVAIVMIPEFVVSATMEHYGNSLTSASDLYRYSDERPPIIYSDFPVTQEGIKEIERIMNEEEVLAHAQTGLYRSHSELAAALQKRQAQALYLLEEKGLQQMFTDWLQQNGKTKEEVLIERFMGRYGNAWLIFDLDGVYIGYF
jgi:hypothetical protein